MHKMKRELKNSDESSELNFEERLIAAIKKHTCLYNKQSISYRKKAVKQNAWHKVAYDVRSDVKECQHRWRSLRDRYVREIRANSNCKWKYMSHLSFLKTYFDSRFCAAKSKSITVSNEELGSTSEAYTTIDHEEKKKYVKHEGTGKPILEFGGKKGRIPVETELVMEDPDSDVEIDEFEHTKDQPITSSSLLRIEIDELQAPNPMAFVEFINDEKRKTMDSVDVNERFKMMSEVNHPKTGRGVKSRNEYYYKTLDSYMLQLPVNVQDDLKIEILNRIYCEVKRRKV